MEMWKPVVNYEGLYEVSTAGRIRNKDHKILKPWRTRAGYLQVALCDGRGERRYNLHRLVATAFIPKGNGCDVVNHINCIPSDNRVENLEWCTQSHNVKYAYDLGRATCVARKRIVCEETKQEFYSSIEAAVWVNDTQFHSSKNLKTISRGIRQCANRERWSAYGHKWSFV